MRFSHVFPAAVLALQLFVPVGLLAVLPSGGQTTSTETWEPDSLTAWDYVGAIRGASGVFLGNYGGEYWVLSAGHVGARTFNLGGYAYSAVSDSSVRINGVGGDSTRPDLVLYRIDPGNATAQAYLDAFDLLEIIDRPLAVTSQVRLVGRGDGTDSPSVKSWGDNSIAGTTPYTIKDTSYGGTAYYTLDSNGVQAVLGDSGGGMFYWTGDRWVLAGIMSAVGDLGNLGGGMVAVPLDLYVDQILAAIPEPGTLASISALLALASVLVARRRTRE